MVGVCDGVFVGSGVTFVQFVIVPKYQSDGPNDAILIQYPF